MIPNLKNLSAYVCVSLLFNHVIRGHKGQITEDMTSLKRSIRYQDTLHNHEIVYRALQKNGALGSFQALTQRCGSVDISGRLEFDKMIDSCRQTADSYEKYGDNYTARGLGEDADRHYKIAEQYRDKVEVYGFLKQYEVDILAEAKLDEYNKQKLMSWNDLTSVCFYEYDSQTNSFQPFDHRPKKKGK